MNRLISIDEQTISRLVKHKSSLLEYVNKQILKREDLETLIGGMHNLQLMLENHRNHIDFISMVVKIGNRDLLYNTLFWVYHSYHGHGFSYDYFLIELNFRRESPGGIIGRWDVTDLGGSLFQSYPQLKNFVSADYVATGFTDALEYAESKWQS